ncbi:hypothetical protein D3C76_1046370 [compost metagenome]
MGVGVADLFRRRAAKFADDPVELVDQGIQGLVAFRRDGILALQTKAQREVHELQYVLIPLRFHHQAREHREKLFSAPGFVMEDAQQWFFAPATAPAPRPVHDGFIDVQAQAVRVRQQLSGLIAVLAHFFLNVVDLDAHLLVYIFDVG